MPASVFHSKRQSGPIRTTSHMAVVSPLLGADPLVTLGIGLRILQNDGAAQGVVRAQTAFDQPYTAAHEITGIAVTSKPHSIMEDRSWDV